MYKMTDFLQNLRENLSSFKTTKQQLDLHYCKKALSAGLLFFFFNFLPNSFYISLQRASMFSRFVIFAMIWNIPFVLNVFPVVWELLFLPQAILQKADHLCQNLKNKLKQRNFLFASTVGQ